MAKLSTKQTLALRLRSAKVLDRLDRAVNRLTSEGDSSLLAMCLPPWLVQHFTPAMAQAQYKCAIRVRDAV